MTDVPPIILCPDERLAALLEAIGAGEPDSRRELEQLADEFPDDSRLFFLEGSLAAAAQDYDAAEIAMRHAIALAPDYGVARFQLGLLLLTKGEGHAAQEIWGPLNGLPPAIIFACSSKASPT